MDSRDELISAHNFDVLNNLVQEDKSVPTMDGENSMDPYTEILNNEETSLPAPDCIVNNDSGENLQQQENIEIKKEDEPNETEKLTLDLSMQSEEAEEEDDDGRAEHVICKEEVRTEGEIALKENLTIQPVEEEEEKESGKEGEILQIQPVVEEGGGYNIDDDDDDDDDVHDDKDANDDSSEEDVTEKEEESSEGTGSSSRESNVEAIWPTDMIEALTHELMNANKQNSVEKMARTECDYLNGKREHRIKNETTENVPILNKKTPQELILAKVETILHLPTREVCIWLLLALIFLLLLLHIHHTSRLQDLSYEKSVNGPLV